MGWVWIVTGDCGWGCLKKEKLKCWSTWIRCSYMYTCKYIHVRSIYPGHECVWFSVYGQQYYYIGSLNYSLHFFELVKYWCLRTSIDAYVQVCLPVLFVRLNIYINLYRVFYPLFLKRKLLLSKALKKSAYKYTRSSFNQVYYPSLLIGQNAKVSGNKIFRVMHGLNC